jgi:hypothetical protein
MHGMDIAKSLPHSRQMQTKLQLIILLPRLIQPMEKPGPLSNKENTPNISQTLTMVRKPSTVQVLQVQSAQLGYGLPQIIKFVDTLRTYMAKSPLTPPLELNTASTTSLPPLWMVTGTGLSLLQEQHQWLPLTQPQFVILSHIGKELTPHVTPLPATLKPLQDVYRPQTTPLPGLLTYLLTDVLHRHLLKSLQLLVPLIQLLLQQISTPSLELVTLWELMLNQHTLLLKHLYHSPLHQL